MQNAAGFGVAFACIPTASRRLPSAGLWAHRDHRRQLRDASQPQDGIHRWEDQKNGRSCPSAAACAPCSCGRRRRHRCDSGAASTHPRPAHAIFLPPHLLTCIMRCSWAPGCGGTAPPTHQRFALVALLSAMLSSSLSFHPAVGAPVSATEFRLESVPELKYDAQAQPPKVGRWLLPGWAGRPAARLPACCQAVCWLRGRTLARLPACLPACLLLSSFCSSLQPLAQPCCDKRWQRFSNTCRARSASAAPWCLPATSRIPRRQRQSTTPTASSTPVGATAECLLVLLAVGAAGGCCRWVLLVVLLSACMGRMAGGVLPLG